MIFKAYPTILKKFCNFATLINIAILIIKKITFKNIKSWEKLSISS